MEKFDRAKIAAYVERHNLSWRGFARHAGVPYLTVYSLMRLRPLSEPKPDTRLRLELAVRLKPPPPRIRHAATVIRLWGHVERAEIARRLGVSPQRVSFIAKRLGLPPLRNLREDKTP